jgi:hypothetical protein
LLWFEVGNFDEVVERARASHAQVIWNRTSTRIPSTEKCGYVTRMVTWLSLQVRTARLVRDSLFLALSPSPRKHNSVGTKSELPVARRVGCSKREQLE